MKVPFRINPSPKRTGKVTNCRTSNTGIRYDDYCCCCCSFVLTLLLTNISLFSLDSFHSIAEDKRRKYDHLGRAGLSNGGGGGGGGFPSDAFSEDFLHRTFHFHNPFDIFEQFMSHFGMDDNLGM